VTGGRFPVAPIPGGWIVRDGDRYYEVREIPAAVAAGYAPSFQLTAPPPGRRGTESGRVLRLERT
jgi:hypothetical protein